MKSRMTLRMGKILEARTAPGNQRRTVKRNKGGKEVRGEWDVIWFSHSEENNRGGVGGRTKKDGEMARMKADRARNKERKAH